jgi:hypothetical protein
VGKEKRGAGSDRQVGFQVVMIFYTKHRASEPFNLIQWLKLMSFWAVVVKWAEIRIYGRNQASCMYFTY